MAGSLKNSSLNVAQTAESAVSQVFSHCGCARESAANSRNIIPSVFIRVHPWFNSHPSLAISATIFAIILSLFNANAAVPALDHLYPVALQRGTTNAISLIGKFDPWPPKIWIDSPGIVLSPSTNSGSCTIEIAPTASLGPHLIRAYNDQGASGPRFLVITDNPQIAEQEPNDELTKAQPIDKLPAEINGRLDKTDDADGYAISLKAGQTITAWVEAAVLGSPVDAVLRVVDSRGTEVAFNHDDGITLDPKLSFTPRSDGKYVVQVFGFAWPADSSIRFTGNNKCVYRLHLSSDPSISSFRLLPSSLSEKEPNNTAEQANEVPVPGSITGCISADGDQDRYTFSAKKGQRISMQVETDAHGFPLDAWLQVEDAKGKQLTRDDDSSTDDPALEWTAPEDGKYIAAIGNLLHCGGSNCVYRLTVSQLAPDIRATVSDHSFRIEPGKTNDIKITIKRLHGFEGALRASLTNGFESALPSDVQCAPVDISEKASDATLKIVASPEAKPFNGPIQIRLTEATSTNIHDAVFELTSGGENNGVPQGFSKLLLNSADQLWLTVLPPAKK